MKNTSAWRWIVLLSLGCTGTPLLDANDDMAKDPSSASGPIAQLCDACFESDCAWPVTECAADPECARWLTCAEQCPTGSETWSSSCVTACPQPSTARGLELRGDLVSCASTTEGCCGAEAGEFDADAGSIGVDAGGGNWGGSGGAGGGGPTAADHACPGDSCASCLWSVLHDKEGCTSAGSNPACMATIEACAHENQSVEGENSDCWKYVTRADCTNAAASDNPCGHVVPEVSSDLTLATLDCAVAYCPSCFPGGNAACYACQSAQCPDELALLMTNAELQEMQWCLDRCSREDDQAQCRQSCRDVDPEVLELYQIVISCRQEYCAAPCAEAP